MLVQFYAHSGHRDDRTDWQTLPDHLAAVERLARARAAPLGLSEAAGIAGRLHDLGKYDPAFDRVLRGENLHVDHSTAGGRALLDPVPAGLRPVAEVLAYAILGHHAGLPDKVSEDSSCLERRIASAPHNLAPEWERHFPIDLAAAGAELRAHVRRDPHKAPFDLSVAVRMIFSCLVDADFRDTETFYDQLDGRAQSREWPALQDCLPHLRQKFAAHMAVFERSTEVNRLRAEILAHVTAQAAMPPGLFTLSVPTGGGKTLASLGFALDHAALHRHRRIVYAIPYTSIIDQTAKVFRDLLGPEIVLEHHSAIETRDGGEAGRIKSHLAMEDWAAPVVVTTNVQLFESLFAARPSRCRKLHNLAGAVIVLDEAQCLPRPMLLPTLAMIDTLATHYGCTVVLCTATQPAFDSSQLRHGGLLLSGRELAPEPQELARKLKRVNIVRASTMDDTALISAMRGAPQSFVIVNSRRHALALYRAAVEEGTQNVVHLSTRQYPAHRRRIIETIKGRLTQSLPCRLISTSLIEAGVDLDFPCGWRAEAGLDSVIQAAGRVNREGKRPLSASTLTVFSAPENSPPPEVARLAEAMRATANKYDDLFDVDAIRDWFNEVYWRATPQRLGQGMTKSMIFDGAETGFPFRKLASDYRLIDSPMVPVIIPLGKAVAEVARLTVAEVPSGTIARAVQPYTVQIPSAAREILRRNGKGSFHAEDLRGDQFFVLDELSLYQDDFGLWWEQAEYLSADQGVI
ncbi:CRISPR-associated helicase Cas3' [Cereibacter sphaeroides]|nr:CRISPR-associated helicase Cas3' [Cereibacter sphaeroides]AZB61059.1 CRISPR-associated helicase Cas3' [Cereibacter sphaeroides]